MKTASAIVSDTKPSVIRTPFPYKEEVSSARLSCFMSWRSGVRADGIARKIMSLMSMRTPVDNSWRL